MTKNSKKLKNSRFVATYFGFLSIIIFEILVAMKLELLYNISYI
ncbi:hypothetical protein ACFL0U_01170 [Pseudomonadota bacterium]